MDETPFPCVVSKELPPKSGVFIRTPDLCRRADRKKCEKHYAEISSKSGFHECPYGLTTAVNQGLPGVIQTALKISGHWNKKKLKTKLKEDLVPLLTERQFSEICMHWRAHIEPVHGLRRQFGDLTNAHAVTLESLERSQDFVSVMIHEVRKLNGQIKQRSEDILKILSGEDPSFKQRSVYKATNVFALSSMVSARLNAFDLENNPDLVTSGGKHRVGIYRKFEKTIHCLKSLAHENDVDITIAGNSFLEFQVYEVFDILPFLLLENAIKYTPSGQNIEVRFFEQGDKVIVSVISVGPSILSSEYEKIFERKYRGRNARSMNVGGGGYGLYIGRLICDLHEAAIDVESSADRFQVGETPFAEVEFRVTFSGGMALSVRP